MLVGGDFAVTCFGSALLSDGLDLNTLLLLVGVGVAAVGYAYWVYRLRRWQVAVCPGG